MPFILHRAEGAETQLLRVQGAVLRIGRGTGSDLLFADTAVGLSHAEIRQDHEGFRLTDLHSVTGTVVNGEPIQSVRLRDDDRITVGPFSIRVQITDPSDPLFLHVAPLSALEETQVREDLVAPAIVEGVAGAEGAAAPPRPPPRPKDPWAARANYAAAYGLRRPYFSKALVSILLIAGAIFWVWHLKGEAVQGTTTFHRPGDLSAAHSVVPALEDCAQCHTPWRRIEDQKCESCHPGPQHAATQVWDPTCGSCHTEHRPGPLLAVMPERLCTQCHADLEVRGGGLPLVAREIHSFDDHPEFRPEVDVSRLRLNHALHLSPGLPAGDGTRVQLACADCHAVSAPGQGGGEIAALSFEQHCSRCHDLRFDDRLPELAAPHGDLDSLYRTVFGTYVKDRDALAALSPREMRRLVFERGGSSPSFDEANRRMARRTTREIVRWRCSKCHEVENFGTAEVSIVPPRVPEIWLTGAHFSHGAHLRIAGVGCESCHAQAAESRQTSDVLLPGIQTCMPCHGGEVKGESPVGWSPTRCVTCHYYHERSPSWPAVTPGSTRSADRADGRATDDLFAARSR